MQYFELHMGKHRLAPRPLRRPERAGCVGAHAFWPAALLLAGLGLGSFPTGRLQGQSYDILFPPNSVKALGVGCATLTVPPVPVANCTLGVVPFAYENTNGHFHNGNRPTS